MKFRVGERVRCNGAQAMAGHIGTVTALSETPAFVGAVQVQVYVVRFDSGAEVSCNEGTLTSLELANR